MFYVKELTRSLAFYRDLLGFQEIRRTFEGKVAALTSGRTHHELLLIEVGPAPGPFQGRRPLHPPTPAAPRRVPLPGLYHIGIKIGDSLQELREAKAELERAGVSILGMSDHTVSQSVYVQDPDGNEVEVYVDVDPNIWQHDPAAVLAPTKPLRL